MKKISRKIYNSCITDANARKALALLIYTKKNLPSSTLTHFSYNRLKELTGIHITTLKKRIKTLTEMGFITRVGPGDKHLLFCNVRDKNSNVMLDRVDFTSVKSVEDGLLAMNIVEIQRRKEYVRQLIAILKDPKKNDEFKVVKKICRKRGYTSFNDNGISYKGIAKKMGISIMKAVDVIKYAIRNNMLTKCTHFRHIVHVENAAEKVFGYLDDSKNLFATKSNIYTVYANTYSIPNDWEAGMVYIRL